jgi:hypothetical protein
MTTAVERLSGVAEDVAARCPSELGREIAVTGSVGAGLADEHSDLEMLFLADPVPSPDVVRGWLASAGASDVLVGRDGSGVWAWCRLDGVELEPFWGSVAEAEGEVETIVDGDTVEHRRLAFAHVITHSTTVRSTGALARLRRRVAVYPEKLRRRLIADAIATWEIPSPRAGAVLRDDRFAVESYLLDDAQSVLRIVFALNRRWEPPRWKWLTHFAATLEVAPADLARRVVAPLLEPDARAAVLSMQELIAESLELIAAEVDADAARRGMASRVAALAGAR